MNSQTQPYTNGQNVATGQSALPESKTQTGRGPLTVGKVHGAGETLRGRFNAAVDTVIHGKVLDKDRDAIARGQEEYTSGKLVRNKHGQPVGYPGHEPATIDAQHHYASDPNNMTPNLPPRPYAQPETSASDRNHFGGFHGQTTDIPQAAGKLPTTTSTGHPQSSLASEGVMPPQKYESVSGEHSYMVQDTDGSQGKKGSLLQRLDPRKNNTGLREGDEY